jgi:hypothetical protein
VLPIRFIRSVGLGCISRIIGLVSSGTAVFACSFASVAAPVGSADPHFSIRSDDVVAFVGGADVVAQNDSGHLETLLCIRFPGVSVRNLAWEGDTVFAQTRDIGFPDLLTSLERAHASVIVLQFGRAEALKPTSDAEAFAKAYEKLLTACSRITPRLVLVAPPPYGNTGGLLPNLASHNRDLAAFVREVHALATRWKLPLIDAYRELSGINEPHEPFTENGLQLSIAGQVAVAKTFARELGFSALADQAGTLNPQTGAWSNPAFERVRQQVLVKDRLWFNYYRPQNWAFLGGDRISQPSSRDHKNPTVRWFPQEMEKYIPLIKAREEEISTLAREIR